MNLTGKIAIVTGGTGWIGTSISTALCQLGAEVFSISRGKSQDFYENAPDNFHRLKLNIENEKDIIGAISNIKETYKKIDILVNNSHEWSKSLDFETLSWDDATKASSDGFVAPLMLTKSVYEIMKESGDGGSIINVTSMLGKVAPNHAIYHDTPGMGNAIQYGTMKAAMLQATRYIASIGGKYNIRCNSISPGPFSRPGSFDNGKEWFREELNKKTMLGRVGRPDELMGAIAFLASDMSSYVTGTDIAVDGGWCSW